MEIINCNNINKYLGKEIGKGYQGSVYKNKLDSSKVIKRSKLCSECKLKTIMNEWDLAREGGNLGVSPVVYGNLIICKSNTEKELYTGYIVMDKIEGKEIESEEQLDYYLDRIVDKMKILIPLK